jgi:hypothetical protein
LAFGCDGSFNPRADQALYKELKRVIEEIPDCMRQLRDEKLIREI